MTSNTKSGVKPDLYAFLNNFKLERNSHEVYTHTKLKGGKYKIPDERLDEFYELLHEDIFVNHNDANDTLTEANSKITQIKVDLDFRYLTDDDAIRRIYDITDIEKIATLYMKHIDQYLVVPKDNRVCFIMEKTHAGAWEDKNGNKIDPLSKKLIIKDGIHMMFPFITTHSKIAHKIRENVISEIGEILDKYKFYNNYNDIVDKAVVDSNNWFLYGCKKAGSPPYTVTRVIKYNGELGLSYIPTTTYSNMEYIRMFSILNKDKTEPWRMAIRDAHKGLLDPESLLIKSDYIKHKTESAKKKRKVSSRGKDELDFVCKLVDMLDVQRAHERKPWIELGWCLHNIHNADETLLKKWIEFSKKDPLYSDSAEDACTEHWSQMREENLGLGTLIMWARIDNNSEYVKLVDNDFNQKLRQFTMKNKLEQNDIAKLMHSLFKHDYVCICKNKSKYVWYKFENHRWSELGSHSEMRLKLSDVLALRFAQLGEKFLAEHNSLGEGADNSTQLLDFSTRATNVSKKLRQTGFKNSVITECQDEFISEAKEFIEKMDENPFLVGCNNGVYDLKRMEFRDGRPDDFITLSTKIDYVVEYYSWEDDKVKDIMRFISQVLPIEEVREYVMKILASTLDGSTKQEKFYIFSGSGGNGKSKLIELLDLTLGDYSKGVSVAMLTRKRADSNAANPELFVTKGRRVVKFQEAEENSRLNVGLMKELTGGDKITARGLFQDPIEFKPQFKPFFICNDKPELPPNDEGTWRRVRLIEFVSRFVDKENPDISRFEFPIDFDLSEKIKGWPEAFLWILIEYYKKYRTEGIREPKHVMEYTNIYRRQNDMFLEFFNECIVQETNGILMLRDAYREYREWFKSNQQGTGLKAKRASELRDYFVRNIGKEYDPSQSLHKVANEKIRGQCWLGYKLNENYSNPAGSTVNKLDVKNLIEDDEDELEAKN